MAHKWCRVTLARVGHVLIFSDLSLRLLCSVTGCGIDTYIVRLINLIHISQDWLSVGCTFWSCWIVAINVIG